MGYDRRILNSALTQEFLTGDSIFINSHISMNNVKITQLISCDISKVSVMQSRQLYVLRRVLQISAKKVFEN